MAHLTYFDTLEEHNAYINSEDYVSPNISYCADADAVFMKENFIPSMSAVFSATSTYSSVKIANSIKGIKAMKIDGQLLAQPVSTYTFTTTGEHTVVYQFRGQTEIPSEFFVDMPLLCSVDLSGITKIGNKNFYFNGSSILTSIGTNRIVGDIGDNFLYGAIPLTVDGGKITVDGNIGSYCFGLYGNLSNVTEVVINGNANDNNFGGPISVKKVRINGNIGNNNIGGGNMTDVYVDGNVGNNNFGGVSSITAMTINGSVGTGNYFSGFDTLHIKGDYGGGGYLSNVKHLIVDGNMGDNVSPGIGLEDILIKGNLGNGNFGSITTLTAVTISGDVGSSNLNSCSPIPSLKIGRNITGSYNFNGITFGTLEIGGNVSDYCFNNCNFTGITSLTINGNVGDESFKSASGLTDIIVDGNVGVRCFSGSTSRPCSISSVTLTEKCNSIGTIDGISSITVRATTPPTLNGQIFHANAIYVPAESVDTYKAASAWSENASIIQAIPTA